MMRFALLGTWACSFLCASVLANEADGKRKLTAGTRTVLAESAAWGAITRLADGSLGITYQVATPVEGTDTVHVAMVWVRSTDGGRTWSKPVTVADRGGPDGFDTRARPGLYCRLLGRCRKPSQESPSNAAP